MTLDRGCRRPTEAVDCLLSSQNINKNLSAAWNTSLTHFSKIQAENFLVHRKTSSRPFSSMEYVRDACRWEGVLWTAGYELLGHLESGGFSDVFAVRSVTSGKRLAVKRVTARRSVMSDPALQAEIACLTRLGQRGSCVIGLEEVVVVGERLACLVLELAPLGDLERYVTQRHPRAPHDPAMLTCCTRQVLTALSHCHRLHIAHRDLHPANVLLVSPTCVRLGDFGLAESTRDARGRPVLCEDYLGREAYLAPEVLRHRPYDATRADLWSMGALVVFLLTGKHPQPPKPTAKCSACPNNHHDTDAILQPELIANSVYRKQCPLMTSLPEVLSAQSTPTYKASFYRSAKEFRSIDAGSKRCRASSCDSEGSCRSESDVEESSPSQLSLHECHPQSIPCPGRTDEESCCCSGGPLTRRESFSFSPLLRETVSDETFTGVSTTLCALVSKLCVQNPFERLSVDDALLYCKQSLNIMEEI